MYVIVITFSIVLISFVFNASHILVNVLYVDFQNLLSLKPINDLKGMDEWQSNNSSKL